MDNGRTSVLAERQDALGSHLGVAQELQGNIFVVLRSFGVVQNLSHLLVMFAAQHELHVVEGLLGQQCQGFFGNLHDFLAFKVSCGDTLFCQKAVLGLVFAQLKHRGVLEINCLCHSIS